LKCASFLVQVKTSQILTIQDLLPKTIMLGPLWTELPKLFSLFGPLNFIKESVTVTVKFPRGSYCSLWAVGVPSFRWLAAYLVDIQYRSMVSWQSLETRYSKLDSRSLILENFKDWGSSRVLSFEAVQEFIETIQEFIESSIKTFEWRKQWTFHALTFDTSESYGKHILALPAVQVHDISRGIGLSENSLRSFSFFNFFYRNLSWMSFTK